VAKFDHPKGIAQDKDGNIYIADNGNHRIRKLSTDDMVTTVAGSGIKGLADGSMAVAQFFDIADMIIDVDGNLIITDASRLRKITPKGDVSIFLGSDAGYSDGDSSSAKFNSPTGLAIDAAGNIYVADRMNNRIRKIIFQ